MKGLVDFMGSLGDVPWDEYEGCSLIVMFSTVTFPLTEGRLGIDIQSIPNLINSDLKDKNELLRFIIAPSLQAVLTILKDLGICPQFVGVQERIDILEFFLRNLPQEKFEKSLEEVLRTIPGDLLALPKILASMKIPGAGDLVEARVASRLRQPPLAKSLQVASFMLAVFQYVNRPNLTVDVDKEEIIKQSQRWPADVQVAMAILLSSMADLINYFRALPITGLEGIRHNPQPMTDTLAITCLLTHIGGLRTLIQWSLALTEEQMVEILRMVDLKVGH